MCGKCGFRVLSSWPNGPDTTSDSDSKSTYVVPCLEQSQLVRATENPWVQASPALLFAGMFVKALLKDVIFDKYMASANPALTAVRVAAPLVNCLSSLAVMWGLQAGPGVKFIANTAKCPSDLQKPLQDEFRFVSYFLGPRLFCNAISTWCMPLFLLFLHRSGCVGKAELVEHHALVSAAYLAFFLACRFMLEAAIVARVAEAHVRTTKDSLSLEGVDAEKLQAFHKACVRLADDILPELAKISGPTLGLAACRAILAFFAVIEVARCAADMGSPVGKLQIAFLLMAVIIDLPVGLYCLLLPASVSDACLELMEHLNNVRSQDIPKEDKAEVDRDSDAFFFYHLC